MTDAEHPIDMLEEAPEGDAAEQRQPADSASEPAGTTHTAGDGGSGADNVEQSQAP